MLKTTLSMPAQPVSLPIVKTSFAFAFLCEMRMVLEEHRRALVATSHANEPRSHSPAVRALYVPALASESH